MTKVRVPGVKVYTSKGILYAYDRATGTRLTPPHALGSPEWWQALQEARARNAAEPAERPGTWGALVTSYRASPRFTKDMAPRTRKDYLAVLDYLAPLHDVALPRWTRSFVAGLRDKAQTQKGRRFANYVLSVVSVVFAHGIELELAATNPVRDVRKLRRPKGEARANRPWSAEEWQIVTEAAPPELLAPNLLGGVLGHRQGEALAATAGTGRPAR